MSIYSMGTTYTVRQLLVAAIADSHACAIPIQMRNATFVYVHNVLIIRTLEAFL
jgi:hypothetical protein